MERHRPAVAAVAGTGVTTVRLHRLLAWLPLGLYGVLTLSGLVLQRRAGIPEDAAIGLAGAAVQAAAILVWSAVGGLLAARRPSNPIGWLLGGIALAWALKQFCFGYAAYGLVAHPGSLPAATLMTLLYVATDALPELGIALLFLLFPDGRLPSPRWRPVLWTGLVATAVLLPAAITDPHPIGNLGIGSPIQLDPALQAILTALWLAAFFVLFGVLLASVASVLLRFRGARGQARQQLKWFAYASPLWTLGWGLLPFGFGQQRITDQLAMAVFVAASVAMPVAVAIAILKYRLYAIDRIINRTIVYGLLSAILGLGYTGAVLLLGQALGRGRSSLAVAGATLVTAALVQPARRQVQEVVDRRFNRRKYDAAKTIEAFSAHLREQVDLDTLTAELLAVVDQTMQPTQASLWLRPPKAPARPWAATSQQAQQPSQSTTVA